MLGLLSLRCTHCAAAEPRGGQDSATRAQGPSSGGDKTHAGWPSNQRAPADTPTLSHARRGHEACYSSRHCGTSPREWGALSHRRSPHGWSPGVLCRRGESRDPLLKGPGKGGDVDPRPSLDPCCSTMATPPAPSGRPTAPPWPRRRCCPAAGGLGELPLLHPPGGTETGQLEPRALVSLALLPAPPGQA